MSNPGKVVSDYYIKDRESRSRNRASNIQSGIKIAARAAVGKVDDLSDLIDLGSIIVNFIAGLKRLLPVVDQGLYKQLETAVQMGDVTIPELMVVRKIFKSHPTIRTTINAVVRNFKGR